VRDVKIAKIIELYVLFSELLCWTSDLSVWIS
jgi:hypothetical protein